MKALCLRSSDAFEGRSASKAQNYLRRWRLWKPHAIGSHAEGPDESSPLRVGCLASTSFEDGARRGTRREGSLEALCESAEPSAVPLPYRRHRRRRGRPQKVEALGQDRRLSPVVHPFTPIRKCLYFYHRCCTKNSTDTSATAVSRDGRCGTITLSRVVSVVEVVGQGSATPRGCAQSGASRHAHQSGCRYAAGAFSGHACRNPASGAPGGPLAFLLRSPKFGLDHLVMRPSAR